MSWRVKIWWFNAGYSACFAVMAALGGSPLCVGFALWAALMWHIGNTALEKETNKEGE